MSFFALMSCSVRELIDRNQQHFPSKINRNTKIYSLILTHLRLTGVEHSHQVCLYVLMVPVVSDVYSSGFDIESLLPDG
jgi:hypothetical protein